MIRLERRTHPGNWVRLWVPVLALLAAFAVITIILVLSGVSAFATYKAMIQASLTSAAGLSQTFVVATPIILTGLCATMAFRMAIYNIGGEGQLYMGAMAATAVALALSGQSAFVSILAMILAAVVAGALWALIPALLRAHLHTNEILVSLMLNYVAGYFITYLIFDSRSYWRDLTSAAGRIYPIGKTIPAAARWPTAQVGGVGIPLGLMLGLLLALACAACLRWTTLGLKMRMVAGSLNTARHSGISVRRLIIVVMLLSGALAGIGGAAQVGSASFALDPTGLQQVQFGYAGIIAAALAAFEPVAVFATGLLLGAITAAGATLVGPGFPVGLVGTIEWIVLFAVISAAFLVNFRVRRKTGDEMTRAAQPEATVPAQLSKGGLR